jgi:hypothetical protein
MTLNEGIIDAIDALKALDKQGPVKISHKHEWFRTGEMKVGQMRCISCGTWGQEEIPQRKPLTRERLVEMADAQCGLERTFEDWVELFAREIEAAHGIKE